ncbi:DNA polymerase IV [Pseudoalteromonas sp. T1lg23B]|uniref:DNA polymerase IV n=1 Tax=Pseudoalteromonas sp. T1lg23B TaxID=2077097 RepID=UPI000CF68EB9|nr:DNA polymerase IV [Pseudoalteromonas sp. T1lg23B]
MRKIAHIDMDAFYVSVEIRDNPELIGKPVAVGGKSDRRGVLSTCNYIARQYGVSSAMPTSIALKKCPDLIVVPGRMAVYKETSDVIRAIFERYTDIIEPLSLDEAYLDLTECPLHKGSATLIAQQIRMEIFRETGLTASAGIAPLKFIAKVASDLNKPNGQYTVTPDKVLEFLDTLSLRKIPGVGKVTSEKLSLLGFETCGDVRTSTEAFLVGHFGKYGRVLWNRCHGIDERAVQTTRIRKSVGVERTFENDVSELSQMILIMKQKLLPELERRATSYIESRGMNKLGVKVKFSDFQQTTKEQAANAISGDILEQLLIEAVKRGNGKPVRLLGVHVGLGDEPSTTTQLGFEF